MDHQTSNAIGQHGGGVAGILTKAAPREPEFQVALKRLAGINARLNELSQIAGASADRIMGPVPEGSPHPSNTKLEGVPRGYLEELSNSLDETSALLERIYRDVTRITNGF